MIREYIIKIDDTLRGADADIDELERKYGAEELETVRQREKDVNAFYKRIDDLCRKKGYTHRTLSEEVGVSEVTFSRYLNGERRISLAVFMGLCRVLEVDPKELYKTYLFANMERRVSNYRKEHEKGESE